MKNVLFFLLLLASSSLCLAQVTTEPAFPTADAPVRIIYDATQGVGNLEGENNVKMHAGVVLTGPDGTTWTNVVGNWGDPSSPGTMTPVAGETDKWEITITPRSYFNVPAGTAIYRIGMVFRQAGPCGGFGGNSTPCKEGKDPNNQDIFVDLFQGGLLVTFTAPSQTGFFVNNGEVVNLTAQASSAADITFTVNGVAQPTQTNTTTATLQITATEAVYNVSVLAEAGGETATASVYFLRRQSPTVQALPNGLRNGINYINNNTATLVFLAPNKSQVFVIGDFNDWQLHPNYQMRLTPDGETHWLSLNGLNPGEEYAFQYLVYDAEENFVRTTDPFVELILDPNNDPFISAETYPDLKPYPTGQTTGIVGVLQTGQSPYPWQVNDFERPKKEDLVIYELLVRDFDTPQNFQAVIDRLDYLQDLGVNAIELMPIMEFAGNISWGYNPIFFTAVDKAYGTRNKLKELIDKCHERGMAVILDMVLNHADFEYPYVKMYFANGQPTNNPWFNPQATHPFSVFFDFNHESDYTKTIMDQINRYWLEEFRFDGYRFDLSKGFTQTQSGSDVGLWSSRDNSRIAILKRMADAIWAYDPEAYVILEHFADNSEEKELAEYRAAEGKGMMTWGNLHGPYKENVLGFSNNSNITGISAQNLTNGGGRGWNVAHLVGYMESHDEERQMVDALQFGNSASGHNVRNRDTALDRLKTAAAFLYTVPGPKMLWQFGELGYDFSINYCPNGSISNDCRTDPKPIRWDYNEDAERQKVYKAMAELIKMRIQYDVFETSDVSIIGGNNLVKLMTITPESFSPNPASANEMSVHIIGNFNVTPQTVSASFQHTGTWYDYFSGSMNAPVNITTQSQSFTLQPGEFRLFTNFPLPSPELELTRYTRPKAPLMAAASALSDIEVQLTWDDVSVTETGYKILRSSTPGGSFTEVGTVGANVETFTDRSGLSAQTTYYYKIVSNNNAGENASAEVSVSTLAPVANPPAAPTNLTAVVVPSGPSVDLAWNDVANNETRYVVERRLASGGSFAAIAQLPANRTSYIDATAQDGESYVYRVGAGIGSVVAYSNEVSLEVLALENNALSQAIRLAPHPGNPLRVMFEGLLVQEVRCRLRDLYGRTVRDFGASRLDGAASVSLNLDGLNPGVYLLEIESEKGRAVKRMVRY